MFDYNPLSSMMMFKSMSTGLLLDKPDPRAAPKPRVMPKLFAFAKSIVRAGVDTGLRQYRLGQTSIAAKWRQIKELPARSSLPE
jgi:hypothetical protein